MRPQNYDPPTPTQEFRAILFMRGLPWKPQNLRQLLAFANACYDTVSPINPPPQSTPVMSWTSVVPMHFLLIFALSCVLIYKCKSVMACNGRAIAQAVSRWLPTAASRVPAQVKSCGICRGQSGTGAGFSYSTSVSSANSHSTDCSKFIIIIIRCWYNRPISGRCTPRTKKKKKKIFLQVSMSGL
jgi:hypothetical protein